MKNQNKGSLIEQHLQQLEQLEKKQKSNKKKGIILASALVGSALIGFVGYTQLNSADTNSSVAMIQPVSNNGTRINQSPLVKQDVIVKTEETIDEESPSLESEETADEAELPATTEESAEAATKEKQTEQKNTQASNEQKAEKLAAALTPSSSTTTPTYGVSSNTYTAPSVPAKRKETTVKKAETKVAEAPKVEKKEREETKKSVKTPKKVEEKKETPKVAEAPRVEEAAEEKLVLTRASFPGGKRKLRAYLAKNVKYPKTALEEQIEGIVAAKISIDENGNITNSKVLKGIGYGCDKAILDVVKKMPKWKPASKNGENIKSEYNISFRFNLTEFD